MHYYLHQLKFDQIQAIIAGKRNDTIGTAQGQSVSTLTERQLWSFWQREIQDVFSDKIRGCKVPQDVMDYFQATKFLLGPPTEPVVITHPGKTLNLVSPKTFTPPRFTWSLTSLQDFENCPLAFAEKRYFKRFKDKPFDAKEWGNRLHKTAEDYALHAMRCAESCNPVKTDLFEPELLAIVKPYCDAIVASSTGGQLYIEHDLAFTEKFQPCSPTDWDNVWYRGKSDVTLVKGDTCYVYDFKSGKIKDDPTQLQLMCACEALMHPQVQRFEGRYIWLKDKKISDPVILTRQDLVTVWREILSRVGRMRAAWDDAVFQARTSGLCKKHCPVTTCIHCGSR